MASSHRYFTRSPDGARIFGCESLDGARAAALEYGEHALVIDTLAQAYVPMLHEVVDGVLVHAGYGGWDTGRFGPDRDLIEAVKKGHVALVHAFLEKGGSANAHDKNGGPALHWAAGGGKADIVGLLLAHGADKNIKDHNDMTALDVATKRNKDAVIVLLSL